MAKNAKYYVVWVGMTPGVYDNWKDCEAQIKGYPNAQYKSFKSRAEAEAAYGEVAHAHISTKSSKRTTRTAPVHQDNIIQDSISVDAACSGNPGKMEYRGVETRSGTELFHMGPFDEGTNNVGEFLAIVHALAMLNRQGDERTVIYSDSKIAQGWVKGGKARTQLRRTNRNKELFLLLQRAEDWLSKHKWKNKILKWETSQWGEIPADFGRK